ncbi:MAG TPA: succinate dehydrogenase assembly factor 2 [Steroidobacteraceae bacterium]
MPAPIDTLETPAAAPAVLPPDAAAQARRILWHCRRGMRELDLILQGYMQAHYASASAAERCTFERLLELPDPQIAAYLLRRLAAPDAELAALVARLVPGRA